MRKTDNNWAPPFFFYLSSLNFCACFQLYRYGGKFAGSAMAKTKKKKAASKKNRPGKARREQMRS